MLVPPIDLFTRYMALSPSSCPCQKAPQAVPALPGPPTWGSLTSIAPAHPPASLPATWRKKFRVGKELGRRAGPGREGRSHLSKMSYASSDCWSVRMLANPKIVGLCMQTVAVFPPTSHHGHLIQVWWLPNRQQCKKRRKSTQGPCHKELASRQLATSEIYNLPILLAINV